VAARNLAHCLVTHWGPHAKTHRTGYCDHHHGEYIRAKRRWQSAVNNYRRGQSPHDPGDWATHALAIAFTPQPDWAVVLDPKSREQLASLADRISSGINEFEQNALYQENRTRIWFAEVEDKTRAMRLAADILNRLAKGEQPQLPDRL